jgi:enoyl-CoA hydratase/carnithine racemase
MNDPQPDGATPEIRTADDGCGVRRITIDRPAKRNALTRAMMRALGDAFAAGEADPSVAVMQLESVGEVFCAGADLDGLAGDPLTAEADPGHRLLLILAGATKPLVAGVQGGAVGVGVTMLLHFDLVYAAPRTTFRTPFVDLGLTPEGGSSFLLPAIMGYARAAPLLLLGEAITAAQALAAGFITDVVPADALAERCAGAARRLAAKPPQALRITKSMMGRADLLAAMDAEQDTFRERMISQEFRDAIEAMRLRVKTPASKGA